MSGDTSQANAYAFGMGPSSRIVLWDTLLDGRFSTREVDVVLAHELAHHSSNHIPEAIGWFALFALPGAFVLMLATRRRGGMGEPAAVPLALLVSAIFSLVVLPGAEPRQPRHGGGGRLEGAADDPTPPLPAGCSRSSRRPRSATRAHRRGRT